MNPSTQNPYSSPRTLGAEPSAADRLSAAFRRMARLAAKAVRLTRQTIRLFILTVRAVFYAVVLFLILAGLYILLTKPVPRPLHPVRLRSFTSIRDTMSVPGPTATPQTGARR